MAFDKVSLENPKEARPVHQHEIGLLQKKSSSGAIVLDRTRWYIHFVVRETFEKPNLN